MKSEVDEGVFYRQRVMYILCTDDSILAAPTKTEVDQAIKDIRKAGLNITVEGNIKDFLGVYIEQQNNEQVSMSQPHLVNQIIRDIGMGAKTKARRLPAASTKILKRYKQSNEHDKSFNYRQIVGKLNYLEKSTRPDVSYATHQCVPITWKSQLQHEIALSTTEEECTGLSYALREVIPIMNLLKDMKEKKLNVSDGVVKVHCKVFEDNSGAIEIAKGNKYRPRTKHLACRLHHFRAYVDNGEISVHKIKIFSRATIYNTLYNLLHD